MGKGQGKRKGKGGKIMRKRKGQEKEIENAMASKKRTLTCNSVQTKAKVKKL